MKKRSLALVLLFPAVLLIWMFGWSLYWIGLPTKTANSKRKKIVCLAEWVKKA
jgi:hypothetical protein